MPNTITPVVEWTTPVHSVADGDPVNAASDAIGIQELTNRTEYLARRIGGVEDTYTLILTNANAKEAWTVGTMSYVMHETTGSRILYFPFQPPVGSFVEEIRVLLSGGNAREGMPENLPQIRLLHRELAAGGSGIDMDEVQDTSPTQGDYEEIHEIVAEDVDVEIAANRAYFIEVEGESGEGVEADQLTVYAAKVVIRDE